MHLLSAETHFLRLHAAGGRENPWPPKPLTNRNAALCFRVEVTQSGSTPTCSLVRRRYARLLSLSPFSSQPSPHSLAVSYHMAQKVSTPLPVRSAFHLPAFPPFPDAFTNHAQNVGALTPKQRRSLLLRLQQEEEKETTSPTHSRMEESDSGRVIGHHAIKTFLSRHAVRPSFVVVFVLSSPLLFCLLFFSLHCLTLTRSITFPSASSTHSWTC